MPRKKVSIIEQRTIGIKMGKCAAIKWIQEQLSSQKEPSGKQNGLLKG